MGGAFAVAGVVLVVVPLFVSVPGASTAVVVVAASVGLQFSFHKSFPSVESVPAFTSETAEPFALTFREVVVDLNAISPENLSG